MAAIRALTVGELKATITVSAHVKIVHLHLFPPKTRISTTSATQSATMPPRDCVSTRNKTAIEIMDKLTIE